MKRLRATLLTLTITGACLSLRTAAQSPGPEWPRFHGAANDNRSLETGLLKVWPDGGPKLLWTATGLGRGYSSVAVHQQRIYTAGMKDKQTEVIALDLDGKEVWRQINGQSWETDKRYAVAYAGSRGTPTCDGDRIYQLAEMGSLSAFDSATGRKVWTVDVLERFGGKTSKYGLSESVLVVGDRLFCCPAGEKGFLVCLDKATGATVWANREIPGSSSYVSLALTEIGGVMQIVGMSSAEAFGVDPKTGALLWTAEHGNQRKNNATNPIVYKGHVFVSTGYGKGSALFRLGQKDGTFSTTPVWSSLLMDNHHGGVVLVGDHLYGSGHRAKGWFCLDFMTGKQAWKTDGKGALTYAEDMLYCLSERGSMSLLAATPDACKIVSTFRLPKGGKGAYWAHPVVCGGRLYIRHADALFAYDIAGNQ